MENLFRMKAPMYYTYDDITLVPRYNTLHSRKEADTSSLIGYLGIGVPIISSNMDTVTESEMALAMYRAGGLGALHRFMPIDRNVYEYRKVADKGADCFCSLGVNKESELARLDALYDAGCRQFIIDIAHGHSIMMKEFLTAAKNHKPHVYFMAGNVATGEAVKDLRDWGASGIKVGIGGGSVCKTRVITGHGLPMFTTLQECSAAGEMCIDIIADGGIRSSGDMVKAFAAGADFVMVGRLLAGCAEAPGKQEGNMKVYRGMASIAAYDELFGNAKEGIAAEGEVISVPFIGGVTKIISDLQAGIKSGITYAGASSVWELRDAPYVIQTHNGYIEGTPHGKR